MCYIYAARRNDTLARKALQVILEEKFEMVRLLKDEEPVPSGYVLIVSRPSQPGYVHVVSKGQVGITIGIRESHSGSETIFKKSARRIVTLAEQDDTRCR
jgi:hypothetical protein